MKFELSKLRFLQCFILAIVASLSGCGGCQRGKKDKLTREELEKKAKEEKDAIQYTSLLTLPTDFEAKVATVKPGHWYESHQLFKSNREDLQVVNVGDLMRNNMPVEIPGTRVVSEFARRTSLPKGQTKRVELECFIPYSPENNDDPFATTAKRLFIRSKLLSWPLMTPIMQTPINQPVNELKPAEFQLTVLSPQALSYQYLSALDAIEWRADEFRATPRTRSYQVTLVKPGITVSEEGETALNASAAAKSNEYAIAHSMLTMTATAIIVWDDVASDDLSIEQQQAIVDWLHWGGQIVISGPSSWTRLQNSFLSAHLPAVTAEVKELQTSDFTEISDYWSVPDISNNEKPKLEIVGNPISGLKFKLVPEAQFLPHSGELVAERQVGRGRVVLTSFPLSDPRIVNWKYFSNFLSTGIFRRVPRDVRKDNEGALAQVWADSFYGSENDARLHSNFKILSRDLPLSQIEVEANAGLEAPIATANPNVTKQGFNAKNNMNNIADIEARRWGGSAAWNDYSGLSIQAVAALKQAAGIKLPERSMIIYLIGGYLAVLVPVNWLFFRILGRLEYAWLAAPVLALIGVGVVTRIARLDIGFARRNTEIALLELHSNHPRGHLTRFVALYTSLSTNYAVEFPESGSVVLPLGDISRVVRRAGAEVQNMRTNLGTSAGVRLEPLTVYSNSTEMVHAEQLIEMPNGLVLKKDENGEESLGNGTGLPLKGALVLRNDKGFVKFTWIGGMADNQISKLNFRPEDDSLWEHWENDPATSSNPSEESKDTLWIGGMLKEIAKRTPLMPGQTRLIAYTDARPGELQILPKEDQFEGRCVVVAHLTSQELGDVKPDARIWSRVSQVSTEERLKEE